MNKRFILLLSSLCLVFPLTGCNSRKYPEDLKIGFLTDYHEVIEDSFYKETYEMVKTFCKQNKIEFIYRKPNGNTYDNRRIALKIMAESGCDYVIAVGSKFGECIEEVIEKFPMQKFIGVGITKDDLLKAKYPQYDFDQSNTKWSEYQPLSNLYCYSFKEEQLGYTVGYSLVKEGYSDIGFIGSYNRSEIVRYGYGYIQGANDASIEENKEIIIRYAYANYSKTDTDITARLDTWFGQGMKAIFACGDYMYSTAYNSAIKDGVKNVKIINDEVDKFAKFSEGKYNLHLTNTINKYGDKAIEILSDLLDGNDVNTHLEEIGFIEPNEDSRISLNETNWGYSNFTYEDYKNISSKIAKGVIKVNSSIKEEPKVNDLVTLYNQGNIKA